MRALLALSLMTVTACGAADAPPGAALPDRCQRLVQGLDACAAVVPADARAPLLEVLKAQRARWDEAARRGGDPARDLDAGCRDALEQVKAATRTACPDVAWDAPIAAASALPALPARSATPPAPDAQPSSR